MVGYCIVYSDSNLPLIQIAFIMELLEYATSHNFFGSMAIFSARVGVSPWGPNKPPVWQTSSWPSGRRTSSMPSQDHKRSCGPAILMTSSYGMGTNQTFLILCIPSMATIEAFISIMKLVARQFIFYISLSLSPDHTHAVFEWAMSYDVQPECEPDVL